MKLPYDEVNSLAKEKITKKSLENKTLEETYDSIESFFIMAYLLGNDRPNPLKVNQAVNQIVDGKTWEERVEEYYSSQAVEEILRVIETETHRIFSIAQYDQAKDEGKTKKRWVTMEDDRVRDTHEPLQGVEIDIDEKFVTWDGDEAIAPGYFALPENNINCRCIVEYI